MWLASCEVMPHYLHMTTTTTNTDLETIIKTGRKWAEIIIVDRRTNKRFNAWNLSKSTVEMHAEALTLDFEIHRITETAYINGDAQLVDWVNAENDKVV